VAVAGGIQNSAAEGQTVSPANIWGKDAYLAHVNAAQDLQSPSFGRTFAWTEETGPDGVLLRVIATRRSAQTCIGPDRTWMKRSSRRRRVTG